MNRDVPEKEYLPGHREAFEGAVEFRRVSGPNHDGSFHCTDWYRLDDDGDLAFIVLSCSWRTAHPQWLEYR